MQISILIQLLLCSLESTGVNVETVRYYERRGLIEQPDKPTEGYRRYPVTTLNRIRFIKRAQELGFTLEEISHLLNAR